MFRCRAPSLGFGRTFPSSAIPAQLTPEDEPLDQHVVEHPSETVGERRGDCPEPGRLQRQICTRERHQGGQRRNPPSEKEAEQH